MILNNELPKFVLWCCLCQCLFIYSYGELKEIKLQQIDLDRERNNFSRLSCNNNNNISADYYKRWKDAASWIVNLTGQQNLTGFINNISTQYESNLDGDEAQIKSALVAQLINVAALAGQPIPRFPWRSDSVHFVNRITKDVKNKNDAPVIQRIVRESDCALKVAAKQTELQQLLQQLYQAEATVQMEVGEVTRSQQIATEAEQKLEEAANKVRMLSADLQAAQENAATCAMRAHTAQLQLAAHDQLMFTARQRVDALSAQMVSVQAELASVQNSYTLNESSQHLEQQGRLNNIYQFQSGLAGNDNKQDQPMAAAPVGSIINEDQPMAVAPAGNNINQDQPMAAAPTGNNINQDQPMAAVPPPPPRGLSNVPSGEQQSYPVYKGSEQQ